MTFPQVVALIEENRDSLSATYSMYHSVFTKEVPQNDSQLVTYSRRAKALLALEFHISDDIIEKRVDKQVFWTEQVSPRLVSSFFACSLTRSPDPRACTRCFAF